MTVRVTARKLHRRPNTTNPAVNATFSATVAIRKRGWKWTTLGAMGRHHCPERSSAARGSGPEPSSVPAPINSTTASFRVGDRIRAIPMPTRTSIDHAAATHYCTSDLRLTIFNPHRPDNRSPAATVTKCCALMAKSSTPLTARSTRSDDVKNFGVSRQMLQKISAG